MADIISSFSPLCINRTISSTAPGSNRHRTHLQLLQFVVVTTLNCTTTREPSMPTMTLQLVLSLYLAPTSSNLRAARGPASLAHLDSHSRSLLRPHCSFNFAQYQNNVCGQTRSPSHPVNFTVPLITSPFMPIRQPPTTLRPFHDSTQESLWKPWTILASWDGITRSLMLLLMTCLPQLLFSFLVLHPQQHLSEKDTKKTQQQATGR